MKQSKFSVAVLCLIAFSSMGAFAAPKTISGTPVAWSEFTLSDDVSIVCSLTLLSLDQKKLYIILELMGDHHCERLPMYEAVTDDLTFKVVKDADQAEFGDLNPKVGQDAYTREAKAYVIEHFGPELRGKPHTFFEMW